MIDWVTRSLKHKAFVVLVFLGIVPLLALGITTNLVASYILESKLNHMAGQTIDKLSLSISKDLQGFVDMIFYHSRNYNLISALQNPMDTDGEKQAAFFKIRSEILQNKVVRRVNYPFHYFLVTQDGSIFNEFSYLNSQNNHTILESLEASRWYRSLRESYTQQIWILAHDHYLSPKGARQIYIASNVISDTENLGTLVIGIDDYYVARLLKNVRVSPGSCLYIIDREGKCLVEGEGNAYPYGLVQGILSNAAGKSANPLQTVEVSGKSQILIGSDLFFRDVEGSWRILMVTPIEDMRRDIYKINYITACILLLSMVVILYLILLVNREIINPILRLNDFTSEVRQGNLEVKAFENRRDEIGQLGIGFNSMVVNLKRYIASIQEEEKIKRELEFEVLQSQINPHFVRNTLNIIRWMAEMMKVPGISQAITSFVRLLDYNYASPDIMVRVRDEIKNIEEYIYLQKLRYQNKFRSRIEIPEELMECRILKLSFQPVVENSILHGFEGKKGLGLLEITGGRDGDVLIFKIRDNGAGMDAETLKGVFKKGRAGKKRRGIGGIGLPNIRERIRLNFGEAYGMEVQSSPGSGTEVTLRMPVIMEEEKEELP